MKNNVIGRSCEKETAWLWVVVLAALSVCAVTLAWFPLLRINSVVSLNYNEGWNAYRQLMAVEGQPLYGKPPALWITNYPFLSFHLVGIFGAVIGNMVLAGRIINFASMIVIAVLAGVTVRLVSGSARGGVYAGLCLFLWIAIFTPERRAVDDPGMLGAAIATFGLLAYVKAGKSLLWVSISALAFAVSLFIKQDLIAFPLSVGAHLLIHCRWRALTIWIAAGVAAACLLTLLTFRLDGSYFLANLLRPRAYVARNLAYNVSEYLLHFGAPMAVCLTLMVQKCTLEYRGFLFILLFTTHAISVFFSGGDGVAGNIFYPALIALALASAVAISAEANPPPRDFRAYTMFALILAVPALAGAALVPFQLRQDLADQQNLPVVAKAAHLAITVLKSAKGPALCEDILLCYEAGKPLGYDPYFVDDQLRIGRLKQLEVLALLTSHHYAAIEIDGAVDTASPAKRRRFTETFMQALLSQYRLVQDNGIYSIFEPRGSPASG